MITPLQCTGDDAFEHITNFIDIQLDALFNEDDNHPIPALSGTLDIVRCGIVPNLCLQDRITKAYSEHWKVQWNVASQGRYVTFELIPTTPMQPNGQ
jgi:hypothetical protein